MNVEIETKAIVTVAGMARMVGLSRARFYQLIGTAFPHPLYDVATRRPFYNEEQQRLCLEVRQRNCGIDGRPILFYARGNSKVVRRPTTATKPLPERHADLVDAVRSLGLTSATAAQVGQAMRELFPTGVGQTERAEVIRAVFVRLKRQNSGDSVER